MFLLFFTLSPLGAQNLNQPLPIDPTLEHGSLSNGMRFIIKENAMPAQKVELYLHINSGSLDEEDHQRGLAHFLEHMAFNGSKNFPSGTLVKYFESLGMTFGLHQNAFTSFDQTTYILSLPNTQKETLDKGLLCLSDFAFRLDLSIEEIDKERGVIEEEDRARSSVQQRILNKTLPVLLPDSRVAKRLPIGIIDIIKKAPRKSFVDFYKKWYHPENCTLLIVGDIRKEDVKALITKHFFDWQKKQLPPKHLKADISPYTTTRAFIVQDKELTGASISIGSISPALKMQTYGNYRKKIIDDIGTWIVNRRLRDMIQSGKARFQSASLQKANFLNTCTYTGTDAKGKSEYWKNIITQVVLEIKRARKFGFHEQEIEDAIKEYISLAEIAVTSVSTRKSSSIIKELNDSISADSMPMSADQELSFLKEVLPSITLSDISTSFNRNFAPENRLITLSLPFNSDELDKNKKKRLIKTPTEKELIQLVNAVENRMVSPLVIKERPKELLSIEPAPGKVQSQVQHKDTMVNTFKFSNGCTCHHKQMSYNKDNIIVTLRFAGGVIEETAANRGITEFATLPLRIPSTSKLSAIDIQKIMTGKKVQVSGGANKDSISITIKGSIQGINEGFKLAYLLIRDAKIEEPIFNMMKQQETQRLSQFSSNVGMQLQQALNYGLSGGDARFTVLNKDQIANVTLKQSQEWLNRILRNAPLEISIVGDISREQILPILNKYIAPIKPRDTASGLARLENLRQVKVTPSTIEENIKVDTETPKALVLVAWRGPEHNQFKDRYCMNLAAKVLSSRLHEEIREKRQLTYSAFSQAQSDAAFTNRGIILSYFTADKTKARKAAIICRTIMKTLAKAGPSAEEMTVIQKQFSTDLKTMLQKPSFWASWLADYNYHHKNLDELKNIEKNYTSYTKEDVLETLQKYFTINNEIMIVVQPR